MNGSCSANHTLNTGAFDSASSCQREPANCLAELSGSIGNICCCRQWTARYPSRTEKTWNSNLGTFKRRLSHFDCHRSPVTQAWLCVTKKTKIRSTAVPGKIVEATKIGCNSQGCRDLKKFHSESVAKGLPLEAARSRRGAIWPSWQAIANRNAMLVQLVGYKQATNKLLSNKHQSKR